MPFFGFRDTDHAFDRNCKIYYFLLFYWKYYWCFKGISIEFLTDNSKLASAKLPPDELQAAFSTMLMNAAAIHCGSVIDPDVDRAEFGESLAVDLAMVRRFSPSDERLYRVLLGDYLRFCPMYLASSADSGGYPQGDRFNEYVLKSLMRAIREAYRKGKKEIPNLY